MKQVAINYVLSLIFHFSGSSWVSAGLFYRRSPQADKFNVSPVEKTKYCRKISDSKIKLNLN